MSPPDWLSKISHEVCGDGRKNKWISELRADIQKYVESTGKDCIALVEEDGNGRGRPRVHHVGIDSYLLVLTSLLRDTTYNGHDVTIAIVQPVMAIVMKSFTKFLMDNRDLMGELIMKHHLGIGAKDSPAQRSWYNSRLGSSGTSTLDGSQLSKIFTTTVDGITAALGNDPVQLVKAFSGFVFWSVGQFPKNLGRRIANEICNPLDENFEEIITGGLEVFNEKLLVAIEGSVLGA